jgi:protease-4
MADPQADLSREKAGAGKDSGRWERELLEKVTLASLAETRRARRWGIFFKGLTFVYLSLLLVLWWPDGILQKEGKADEHTAMVEIKGVIAPETDASADNVVTALRDAFEDEDTKGVILRINSPGGSPVQAGYINDEVRRLKEKYPDIPVYAVIVDVCASGGYYIAVAADEIYADKGSLVGSIGVMMNGFGFVDTLEELGIERRLLTAGEHKGIMDPFSPVQEEDRAHVQNILDQLFQQFVKVVREGRGDRLKEDDKTLSGLFWSGEQSVQLGLVDGLGSSSYVARELIGAEDIVNFTPEKDLWTRFADRLGASMASTFARISGVEQVPWLK